MDSEDRVLSDHADVKLEGRARPTPLGTASHVMSAMGMGLLLALCLCFVLGVWWPDHPLRDYSVNAIRFCFFGAMAAAVGGLITGILSIGVGEERRTSAVVSAVLNGCVVAVLLFVFYLALHCGGD